MAAAINILTSKSSNCFKMSFQKGVPVETSTTQTQNKRGSQPVMQHGRSHASSKDMSLGQFMLKKKKEKFHLFLHLV